MLAPATVIALVIPVAPAATGPALAARERCHAGQAPSDLYITMSDGVRLRYGFDLPGDTAEDECSGAPYPVVLQVSAYGHGYGGIPHGAALVEAGYAVIGVSSRGVGCSGGTFDSLSQRERQDVHEIIGWLAKQWWSDGRVALLGSSYPAIQALAAAPYAPNQLRAVVAGVPSTDLYRDTLVPGGIPNASVAFAGAQAGLAALAVASAVPPSGARGADTECAANYGLSPETAPLSDSLKWEWDEGIVHERSPIRDASRIEVPVLLAAGWQDEIVGSRGVEILRELKTPYHAILTNGGHWAFDTAGMRDEVVAFLNHYVKNEDAGYDQPRVELWWDASPSSGARWKTSHDRWPIPVAKPRRLRLGPAGTLSGAKTAATGSDPYTYAPATGQSSSFAGGWATPPKPGSYRAYTYDVQEHLVVAGSASLDVWMSSTATDTDLQVVLTEVTGGEEVYVAQGFLRASHRELDPKRSTATRPYHTHQPPGQPLVGIEKLRVEIMPFAHAFRKGTKLRVYIESPRLVDTWPLLSDRDPALNTIHYGETTPSALVLAELDGVTPDEEPTVCDPTTRRLCRADGLNQTS